MCRGLARAGAQVRVVTTNADLHGTVAVAKRRTEENMEILTRSILPMGQRLAARYGFAPGLVRTLWIEIARTDLCVLQGPWTFSTAVGAWICRWRLRPYVLCPRGALEELSLCEKAAKKQFFMRWFGSWLIRNATAIQFASHTEERTSRAAIGSQRSFVCENAIDPGPRVMAAPAWLKRRLEIPDDSILVGLAGRVHPRKGFEIIVPALARCQKPVHLVSFGANEGDHQTRIEAIAREHGVRDRLHFLGTLDGTELQKVYASLDLFVLPSLGESFGNVAIEALAQGTLVLVSDAVPVGAYVERNGFGAVVTGGDSCAWAKALDQWTSATAVPIDREAMARQVRNDFDVGVKGTELLRAYEELVPCHARLVSSEPSFR
jgi:glycosyltransferase involved in cell wall biosynthesis